MIKHKDNQMKRNLINNFKNKLLPEIKKKLNGNKSKGKTM